MTDFYRMLSVAGSATTENWRVNPTLRIALGIGIIVFYIVLFVMLKRKTLLLRYTLIWMISGLVLVIILIFPQIVMLWLPELIGVGDPVNAIFLVFAGFSLLLSLSLTSIVSQISDKNRTLIQQVALLEKRVRELEEKQTDKKK